MLQSRAVEVAALDGVDLSEMTLRLPAGLAYSDWEKIVVALARMERAIQWWLGDALVYGEAKFGDKYGAVEAALARAGLRRSRDALRAYAWVAAGTPAVLRNTFPDLSWWHFRTAASVKDLDLRRELLAHAAGQRMGIREFRALVRWPQRVLHGENSLLAGSRWRLLQADVVELAELLPPGNPDVVLTDPPWSPESLSLYDALGQLAIRVLEPGGVVGVLSSVAYLPQVMAALSENLNYLWTMSVDLVNPAGELGSRPFYRQWRPFLVYVVGQPADYAGPWFSVDKVTAERTAHRRHRFEASEAAIAALVERVTRPDSVVLDPFVGAGTVGAAALTLGRRFIGSDLDPAALALSAERLTAVAKRSDQAGS